MMSALWGTGLGGRWYGPGSPSNTSTFQFAPANGDTVLKVQAVSSSLSVAV
jgi:hypothetical protein